MPSKLLSEFRLLLLVFFVAAAPQVGYVAYREISERSKQPEAAPATPAAKPAEAAQAARSGAGPHQIVCLGQVDLEGGVAPLAVAQPSRVVSLLVKENQRVEKGALLLATEDTAAKEAVREAESLVRSATEQLTTAQRMSARHAIRLRKQQLAIDAAQAKAAAAKQSQDWKESQKLRNPAGKTEAAVADQLVKEADAGVEVEQATLEELKLVDPQQGVREAEADLQRAQAKLAQAQAALEALQLRAPAAGTVLRIMTHPGQIMAAAAPALLFAAEGRRIVRAEIEQADIDSVVLGAKTTIEDDAVGGRKWQGKVLYLADWYSRRRAIIEDSATFQDVPTVECVVSIDDTERLPRINQRVRVHIETGTKPAAAAPDAETDAK